jgi:hypothetical protein
LGCKKRRKFLNGFNLLHKLLYVLGTVCMTRIDVFLPIWIFKVEKFWTEFNETLYECYAIEGHPKL